MPDAPRARGVAIPRPGSEALQGAQAPRYGLVGNHHTGHHRLFEPQPIVATWLHCGSGRSRRAAELKERSQIADVEAPGPEVAEDLLPIRAVSLPVVAECAAN